ncbi:MAG: zinc ABC transporter substrate-binding protein [Anaerolineae bacterium]
MNLILRQVLRVSALFLLVLAWIAAPAEAASAQTKLKVVTSITILQDIARNVAGDAVELSSIVPTDGDAHEFEPTPDDIRKVADANLIFVNGAGLEGFIDGLIADSGTQATVITASAGLPIREFGAEEEGEAHADELAAGYLGVSGSFDCGSHTHEEGEAEHGGCDPHLWQDPTNIIVYTINIRDALIAADPANADAYRSNAAKYIVALKELDKSIWQGISSIPVEKRILVTNHDALGYWAGRYGFQIAGIVLPGGGTSAEPSPQEVAALVDSIRQLGVPAIFTENIANNRLAQQIADEAGIQVVQSLYTDALSAADGPASTYLNMMNYNLMVIVSALGGSSS